MKNLLIITLLFTSILSFSQGDDGLYRPEDFNVKKYYLITASTKDYGTALRSAKSISEKMGLKLDLRGLEENEESGLSMSSEGCEENGFSHPCYVARGRYDNGEYVSIEWSNAISGFTKGYYVVIIATNSTNDAPMKALLAKAKEFVASAYIKSADVYMGCMH